VGGGVYMNWQCEVESRIKKGNQVLFDKNGAFLADLVAVIQQQNHRALVLWAFEFADETVKSMLEKYPNEHRLETAVLLSKDWAFGKIKMSFAKQAILKAHAAAKDMTSLEDLALCHAVGQACSVVHTRGHSIGYPIYELTSLVRKYGLPKCEKFVEERKQQFVDRLLFWQKHEQEDSYEWAAFLIKTE